MFRSGHNFHTHNNLPEDYLSLTEDGQKIARVNACTIMETPEDAVRSWSAFRDYYLAPDDELEFDPGFYDRPYLESPTLHYKFVRWWRQYDRIALAWPRSCAKSSTKRAMILWLLLTQPRFAINTYVAKEDFLLEEFYRIKSQIETNPRILQDFGTQRPSRGEGVWNNHILILENGSILRGYSIEGKKRGPRCHWAVLDDVEYDEEVYNRTTKQVEQLKENVLKIITPMLQWGGRLTLQGTLLSRRNFLYKVLRTDELPQFRSIKDGGRWFKLYIPARDASGLNAWAALYTNKMLEERREELGQSWFDAEYMNNPTSDQSVPFVIRPSLHEYRWDGRDGLENSSPWVSKSEVRWTEINRADDEKAELTKQPRERKWVDVLAGMTRVVAIDYASSLKKDADYSCVMVCGLDAHKDLWVLDVWYGRVTPNALMGEAWRLVKKWRVSVVGVETEGGQTGFFHSFVQYIQNVGQQLDYPVSLRPLQWRGANKADRISSSLEWRFNGGRIKLPSDLKETPEVSELYSQITNFTKDLRNLQHDDVIDALAMTTFVLGGNAPAVNPTKDVSTPLEVLLSGGLMIPNTSIPAISMVDIGRLSMDQLYRVIDTLRSPESPDADPMGLEEQPLTVTLGGGFL